MVQNISPKRPQPYLPSTMGQAPRVFGIKYLGFQYRCWFWFLAVISRFALLLFMLLPRHALGKDISVLAQSKTQPELCAEKDNVEIDFRAPDIASFNLIAQHPAYIGTIVQDRYQPDFTSCDMSHDPSFSAKGKRVTFWESMDFWLTGYTYPSFWRPAHVPFRVGDHVENGLHMVQLWMLYHERAEEIVVVYPPDGYWRARPLPPDGLRWSAYGSSFLIGPVETLERPIVELKEIAFDPPSRTFTLSFTRGGSAKVAIGTIDQDHIELQISYQNLPIDFPFAALRSMFTTRSNNDVAEINWRTAEGKKWEYSQVMDYKGGALVELWAGRSTPSRHNLSAPDIVFSKFNDGR